MSSLIDPEIKRFLSKVLLTVFVGIIWLTTNALFGLGLEYAFILGRINAGNIFFFGYFGASTIFMLYYLRKTWKDLKIS